MAEGRGIAGDWQGMVGEKKRRLVVRIAAADDGGWRATFHPVDQTAQPVPIDAVVLEGHSLKLAINAIRGTYEGTVSADLNSIAGTWTQEKSLPLELRRATKESAWLAAPTPYQVQFIEVEAGVKLEVVDWGGSGRPLVLLAGLGANAHTYDKFAARLTPSYHVYGITRRGFGASSVPPSGYSADRLGDDVLAVLAALKVNRPVLAGNSIAGQELSSVGSRHPDKVAGLVYLDAAYSYAYYDSSLGDLILELVELRRKLEELQSRFLEDTRPLIQELLEADLPRLERVLLERQKDLRATPRALLDVYARADVHLPPSMRAIHAGRQKYTHIPVPILAIYALPPNFDDLPGGDPVERAAFEARTAVTTEAQAKAFEAGVPSARVVRLPHARHEVFSSNEDDVLREMYAFIGSLKDEPAKSRDIEGAWLGTLDTGDVKLRLLFHITVTEDGLVATVDSIDQGVIGTPATGVECEGDSVTIEMKQIDCEFEGTIKKDHTEIAGNWSRRGMPTPLVLTPVKNQAEFEFRRPQNPRGWLPYRHEDVTFLNGQADIQLAGTLTVPPGQGLFPAVVLIAGSGPHGRDETVAGHKPFLVLSDYLTRYGVLVLRYDKRGIGQSGGNYASATTADLASDAQAAFAYLRRRPEVNAAKVGLIGHSEGAIIAPMVVAGDPQVAFIIMMAASGVPGDEVLVEQTLLISEAMGMSPEKAAQKASQLREIIDLVEKQTDNAILEKDVREKLRGKVREPQLEMQIKTLGSPWFRYFLSYDPATTLEKVTCPVLVLSGAKDLQVPPRQNLPAIRKVLEASGNKRFEIDELPGLNHLFQPATTGSVAEYSSIETTVAPVVLEKISSWILKQ